MPEKITVPAVRLMKGRRKIAMVTAYDYMTARLAEVAQMDIVLVGDSLANVIQGRGHTLEVTVDAMVYHTRMVKEALTKPLLVADMPFGSYHVSVEKGMENAVRLIQQGGAEAVKLEGASEHKYAFIARLVEYDIPVMGHIGLTPQSIHAFGSYRVQGKQMAEAENLVRQACMLSQAGVFAVVLEGIPAEVAALITEKISIPTIGIGAGAECDGQVLVIHDLLGMGEQPVAKFVKQYARLWPQAVDALKAYAQDVRDGRFPGREHVYQTKTLDINLLRKRLDRARHQDD